MYLAGPLVQQIGYEVNLPHIQAGFRRKAFIFFAHLDNLPDA